MTYNQIFYSEQEYIYEEWSISQLISIAFVTYLLFCTLYKCRAEIESLYQYFVRNNAKLLSNKIPSMNYLYFYKKYYKYSNKYKNQQYASYLNTQQSYLRQRELYKSSATNMFSKSQRQLDSSYYQYYYIEQEYEEYEQRSENDISKPYENYISLQQCIEQAEQKNLSRFDQNFYQQRQLITENNFIPRASEIPPTNIIDELFATENEYREKKKAEKKNNDAEIKKLKAYLMKYKYQYIEAEKTFRALDQEVAYYEAQVAEYKKYINFLLSCTYKIYQYYYKVNQQPLYSKNQSYYSSYDNSKTETECWKYAHIFESLQNKWQKHLPLGKGESVSDLSDALRYRKVKVSLYSASSSALPTGYSNKTYEAVLKELRSNLQKQNFYSIFYYSSNNPQIEQSFGACLTRASLAGDSELYSFLCWWLVSTRYDAIKTNAAQTSIKFYYTKVMSALLLYPVEKRNSALVAKDDLYVIANIVLLRSLAAQGHPLPYQAFLGLLLIHFRGIFLYKSSTSGKTIDSVQTTLDLVRSVGDEKKQYRLIELAALSLWLSVLLDVVYFYRRMHNYPTPAFLYSLGYLPGNGRPNHAYTTPEIKCGMCYRAVSPYNFCLCSYHSYPFYIRRQRILLGELLKSLASAQTTLITISLSIYLFEAAQELYSQLNDSGKELNVIVLYGQQQASSNFAAIEYQNNPLAKYTDYIFAEAILMIVRYHVCGSYDLKKRITELQTRSGSAYNVSVESYVQLLEYYYELAKDFMQQLFKKNEFMLNIFYLKNIERIEDVNRFFESFKGKIPLFRGLATYLSLFKNGCKCQNRCYRDYCECWNRRNYTCDIYCSCNCNEARTYNQPPQDSYGLSDFVKPGVDNIYN